MSEKQLEQLVLAYYVAFGAQKLSMVPRAWSQYELLEIIEDKVQFTVRSFGVKAMAASAKATQEWFEFLLKNEGFSTTIGPLNTVHKYQPEPYRKCIEVFQRENAIIQQANSAGQGFWETKFAELTG